MGPLAAAGGTQARLQFELDAITDTGPMTFALVDGIGVVIIPAPPAVLLGVLFQKDLGVAAQGDAHPLGLAGVARRHRRLAAELHLHPHAVVVAPQVHDTEAAPALQDSGHQRRRARR